MRTGTLNGPLADAQRLAATNIEKGLQPFRDLLRGKPVSLRIIPAKGKGAPDPLSLYVSDCVREMVFAEGGRLVEDGEGEVQLEIYSVQEGINITERNFAVPLGQYLRIPLIYTERLAGESGLIVLARDVAGQLIPRRADRGREGETEYYLFRFIGPFRR